MPVDAVLTVLDRAEWEPLAEAHRTRVDAWVQPHLERRRSGVKHPVEDFLFGYYSFRPAALRRWHPGYAVGLRGADEVDLGRGYVSEHGVTRVSEQVLTDLQPLLRSTQRLLSATAARAPHFGCFGMHEWAMVHRLPQEQVRHAAWPLRLGTSGTDEVVESHRIACSHFDAFRFYTPSARPLNSLQPGRDDRPAYEQPACLHAGMDLYKHAFRLVPLVPSSLVADCFDLAREIRTLDMRASPYDLSGLGHAPVRVETAEGKAEYAAAQRAFAERGAPLRARLMAECERLLAHQRG